MAVSSSRDRPADSALPEPVGEEDSKILVGLARESIRIGAETGRELDLDPGGFSSRLGMPGASFVTLELDGDLRGCIGSLEAYRPLVLDVVRNADGAARRDPRFAPVNPKEVGLLEVHVSVLGPPVPLEVDSETELLQTLRPGIDGLTLEAPHGHRATFLPKVWDQLPEAADFLHHLKRKAQLPGDYWSPEIEFWRYRMMELH